MRHKKNTKKFKRTEEERKRLMIDLTRALIKHGQIVTFTTRGKWFRPFFERLVTLCKRANDDVSLAFRRCTRYLDEETARKFVEQIVPKLKDRKGGYTRQYKLQSQFNSHLDKSVIMIVD